MKTIYLNKLSHPLAPCVATVGFFDGVHRGHQYLISQMKAVASAEGLQTTVVTFAVHPRLLLDPSWQPQLITTLQEKTLLLGQLGVDNLVVIEFDLRISRLTAFEFMQMLNKLCGAQVLFAGYDNRFGHRREEGFDDYVRYGGQLGMRVLKGQPLMVEGLGVSSSMVRAFLSDGEVEMAARCLGRPYILSGRVVEGRQVGRQLGFPTANMSCPTDAYKMVPAPGVYGVRVLLSGLSEPLNGMMNIGVRPTFAADDGTADNGETPAQTIETHIFDYDGNLYSQNISVAFMFRQRGEQKFSSPARLKAQLQADAAVIYDKLKSLKDDKLKSLKDDKPKN